MPSALKPALRQDGIDIRDRSPHPYARKGSISRLEPNLSAPDYKEESLKRRQFGTGPIQDITAEDTNESDDRRRSTTTSTCVSASHTASSESGTEADDEHEKGAHFLKALPAPTLRPRKGWKGSPQIGGDASPLLTPAQLDRDARTVSQDYFASAHGNGDGEEEEQRRQGEHARELFERRKRAERIRRISEAALLGAIGLIVISGHSVRKDLLNWHRELLSQALTVAFVIALYPLRVLSRELLNISGSVKDVSLLRRFKVPPSFDPASVLYPTFVPVLVALSLLPQYPALLLPNLILGLASLPPRLFPATSLLATINPLGWMVAIVPLVASENTALPHQRHLPVPYILKVQGPPYLHPEMLVLLYPLHQVLLPPLNYLTTTSLLPAEKHMLAAGLANLLCFAASPQASILRAMLWVGGVWVLVICTNVLNWNVTLARVPTWRFRRVPSRKGRLLDELIFTVRDLISARRQHEHDDSDADEDGPLLRTRDLKAPRPNLSTKTRLPRADTMEPKSAVEASPSGTLDFISTFAGSAPKRRHTMESADNPSYFFDRNRSDSVRPRQRTHRKWYLDLTLEGAVLRKWLYACWIYAAMIAVILVPVRMAVSKHALQGAEPILWAIEYVFGDIITLYNTPGSITDSFNAYVSHVQAVVLEHFGWHFFSMPAIRLAIGEANSRILVAAYWVVVVAFGLATVTILAPRIEVDTRRKIFHATIVTMLLPTTFVDPCFCGLALGIVLAIFLLLEVIRAGQVPPLGAAIGRFVAPYVDGRDLRGPMVVSHVFLLIGCAIPLWLSLSGLGRDMGGRWPGWETEHNTREVAMIAGVVCVGMGDAAASLIGRRYGRRKWPWIGGKSLEGSSAFAIAVMVGLMAAKSWLHFGGWQEEGMKSHARFDAAYWTLQCLKALICGCGASFMEAVLTGANDNVVVPVALWLLVRGVGF